jgi:hypothetical protein
MSTEWTLSDLYPGCSISEGAMYHVLAGQRRAEVVSGRTSILILCLLLVFTWIQLTQCIKDNSMHFLNQKTSSMDRVEQKITGQRDITLSV